VPPTRRPDAFTGPCTKAPPTYSGSEPVLVSTRTCLGGEGSIMSSMSNPASPITCTYPLSGRWANSKWTPGATSSITTSSCK